MSNFKKIFRQAAGVMAVAAVMIAVGAATIALPDMTGTALAQQSGEVPGQSLGSASDAEFWRAVREGEQFTVSIPDKKSGVMIQSEGENWRNARNGPVTNFGGWIIVGMLVWLGLFFAFRGRIKIDSGFSGKIMLRFNSIERIGHWLTAVTFIILGLTGLNMMYGTG
jgi:formate dehydrogenase subunit gamma